MGFFGASDTRINATFTATDRASPVIKGIGKSLTDLGTKSTGPLGGVLGGLGMIGPMSLVAVGGIAGLSIATKGMIDAASDLHETMSKVNVVFGDGAADVEQWGENAATALGMSKQEALEAAGTYGNLFQAFGVTSDKARTMSKRLVELAADMASFNNTSVDDALIALRSGLSGETEPLKRYGVALSDARMRQELMAQGATHLGTTLTPLQKSTAAYSIILHDTSLAQGDFARTSDGLANKQKILDAKLSDLAAKIGGPLSDAFSGIVSFIDGPVLDAVGALIGGIGNVGTAFDNLHRFVDAAYKATEDQELEIRKLAEAHGLDADAAVEWVNKQKDAEAATKRAADEQAQYNDYMQFFQRQADQAGMSLEDWMKQNNMSVDALQQAAEAQDEQTQAIQEADAWFQKFLQHEGMHQRYLQRQARDQEEAAAATGTATDALGENWAASRRAVIAQMQYSNTLRENFVPAMSAGERASLQFAHTMRENGETVKTVMRDFPRVAKGAMARFDNAITSGGESVHEHIVDMKKTLGDDMRALAFDLKHPFQKDKYEDWLERTMKHAKRQLAKAQKTGDADMIAEAQSVVDSIQAEYNRLNGRFTINTTMVFDRLQEHLRREYPEARAGGGPVAPGTSYVVGEHGPEVLTMGNQSGYVHANGWGGVPPHSHPIIVDGKELGQAVASGVTTWQGRQIGLVGASSSRA